MSEIRPGDEFTFVRTADPYRAIYYAGAGGDFNPIHIDPFVGEKAGLGGPILQGLCTMSWMVESAVSFVGDPTRITKSKVRFSRPVRLGDTITFTGKVTKIESGRMTAEIAAINQRGEEVLKGGLVEAVVGGGAR